MRRDWRSLSPLCPGGQWAHAAGGVCSPAAGVSGTYLPEPRERRRGGDGVTLTSVSGDSAGVARHTANKRPPSSSSWHEPFARLPLSHFLLDSNSRDVSRQVGVGGLGSFLWRRVNTRVVLHLLTGEPFGFRVCLITPGCPRFCAPPPLPKLLSEG